MKSKSDCEALEEYLMINADYCMKKICYNPTPVKSELTLEDVKTQIILELISVINQIIQYDSKNNSSYCLTTELESGRVKPASSVTIQECNAERRSAIH